MALSRQDPVMPDHLEPSFEAVFSPALIDALSATAPVPKQAQALAKLREQLEKVRAATARRRAELDALCAETLRRQDAGPDELTGTARVLLKEQQAAVTTFYPQMEAFYRKLSDSGALHNAEARALFRKSVDAAKERLALYGATCELLLRLADERRSTPLGPRSARPVEGNVDYDAMTRETVARFPGILAALAE